MSAPSADLDALVVGSGPNGLAAAVILARAGLRVHVAEAEAVPGGGARTLDLDLAPGIVHDICSAVHPMAVASPFFRAFDLTSRGVDLAIPEASYAQPLDGGRAAIAWRDIERTASGLGPDGAAWRRLLGPLADSWEVVTALGLGDKRSIPRAALSPHGIAAAARFGAAVLTQGTPAWSMPLRTDAARALLTGVAAHAISPLPSLAAAGTAVMLAALAHGTGWPIPVGGSGAITAAMLEDLRTHGATLGTSDRVDDLPVGRATAVLLDTSAEEAVRLLGPRLRPRVARGLRRLGHGGAAAKVDLVLSGPIPWTDPDVGRAGTVHLGGSREDMMRAENDVLAGRLPEHPLTLLSDPTVADPSRRVGALRPIWAYAHVPLACTADPTEMVLRQIERFAPGARDLVVASGAIPASEMPRHNPALVGGDIALGTVTMARMVARPRAAWNPWRLTDDGAYLCSSAAVPGPGVHGMAGVYAAATALRERFGIRELPSLTP